MRKANGTLTEKEVTEIKKALRSAPLDASKKELFDIGKDTLRHGPTRRAESQIWARVFAELRAREEMSDPDSVQGMTSGEYL